MSETAGERRGPGRPKKGTPPKPRKARPDFIEPIDLHIGLMVRAARTSRGMTREALAARLNLGPEAVEKYERAEARVPSGRLWEIAQILEVPVATFFDGFTKSEPPPDYEVLLKAMTVGNMQICLDLQRLTFGQRRTVRDMIDGLLEANEALRRAGERGERP